MTTRVIIITIDLSTALRVKEKKVDATDEEEGSCACGVVLVITQFFAAIVGTRC